MPIPSRFSSCRGRWRYGPLTAELAGELLLGDRRVLGEHPPDRLSALLSAHLAHAHHDRTGFAGDRGIDDARAAATAVCCSAPCEAPTSAVSCAMQPSKLAVSAMRRRGAARGVYPPPSADGHGHHAVDGVVRCMVAWLIGWTVLYGWSRAALL